MALYVVIPTMTFGLLAMLLNTLAVITVVRTRSLWTPSHLYITSLAVSDLLLGVLILCIGIRFATEFSNRPMCLTLWFFFVLVMWASVLMSAVISVDRFVCIAFPYFYERAITNAKVAMVVASTWLAAVALSLTMLIIGIVKGPKSCVATEVFADTHHISIFVFFVCFVISGVMYGIVSRLALRQLRMVAAARVIVQAEIHPLRETFRQKVRAVKMFVIVFGVFVVCWLPHNVAQIVQQFACIPTFVSMALSVPGMLNSVCNFFIYFVISTDFRVAFKRLCRRM